MSKNNDYYNNELRTKQDDWIRLFDLQGVVGKITDNPCGGAGSTNYSRLPMKKMQACEIACIFITKGKVLPLNFRIIRFR